jgi:plasmid stabilization system protein ParE
MFFAAYACSDLRQIQQYLEQESIKATRRILSELTAAFRSLARTPYRGHLRQDLTDRKDLLFWPVCSYLIVYRPGSRHSVQTN